MDPASAIIGIVSFGFTVFAKVNEIRKSIKGAPQQVQALQESYVVARVLLSKLQTLNTHTITYTADELACFELLCERSQQCLRDVDEAVKKVMAKTSDANAGRTPKVRLLKWFLNKADFEEMTKKLKDVREALGTMVDLMQLNHLQVIAVHVINDVPRRTSSVPNQSLVGIDPSPPRRTGSLQCSHDCTCHCHARFHIPLIPQSLAPYVGQLFISKQLLHPAFTPWNCCNVVTCRGTYLKPAKVAYTFPQWSLLHGSFQTSSFETIHLSLNAYRTVSYSSPIIQAIWRADVCRVRNLFAKQQASIWDVDIKGDSILWHACGQWRDYPTEDRLGIVRFLVEAGADTLLFADTETAYSPHDLLAIGLFAHLLGEQEPGRSFTGTIQTNSAAITVFRSIFNIDTLDALQDVLSRCYGHSDEDASRLLTSLEATEYAVARSSLFNAIGCTPLQYAIVFSPSSVESLLAEGADVAAEPTLAYAAHVGRSDFIELFVDNGADVNMKYKGRTALHCACYGCYYNTFFELVRCAEDQIDWDARTPEGQNALDLFDEGVSRGHASGLTSEQINEFRSTLVSHMDPSQLHVVEDEPLDIPGAFPLDPEF